MHKFTPALLFLFLFNHAIAQNAIKAHEGVKIGGIKQWVGARSKDDSKPLLLFLHGGPGFSSRAYSKKFIKHLQRDFIVAQWDQRGSGITAAWNPAADSLSIDLMHSDTKEVIDYLLEKFQKKKLYLVGFSWGGYLGLHYASQYPENLHAYVSVSSMLNGNESERLTLAYIREQAAEAQNKEAVEELAQVDIPFESWEQLYFQRKWTAFFSGVKASQKTYPKRLFEEWSHKWMPLFLEASATNHTESILELKCPVYFFLSKKDLVANYNNSLLYIEQLTAPKKEIVWFTESTHEIPSQEPKKFSQEILQLASAKEK